MGGQHTAMKPTYFSPRCSPMDAIMAGYGALLDGKVAIVELLRSYGELVFIIGIRVV